MYRQSFTPLAAAVALVLSAFACESDVLRVDDGGNGTAVSPYFSDIDAGLTSSEQPPAPAPDAGARACFDDSECDDGDSCTGSESCVGGFCRAGDRPACFDGDPCTLDSCEQATGVCKFEVAGDGTPCADGNLCDGQTCQGGTCMAGPAPVCAEDTNPCTTHQCDPLTGGCTTTVLPDGASCTDGNACNGAEVCSSGVCSAGAAPACNDQNPCTNDVCDPVVGCVNAALSEGAACSDGNQCNGLETCHAGACQGGTAPSCNDNNPCTADACLPTTGACQSSPLPNGVACPDGNLCDGQTCMAGVCTAGSPVVCATDNDTNPCTFNGCQPATGTCGQTFVTDGTACADDNVCNGVEACLSGRCVASQGPLVCPDDNNACTTSVCSATQGCITLNLEDGSPCGDTNLCNGVEACVSGVCLAGTTVTCPAFGSCDPNTGLCSP